MEPTGQCVQRMFSSIAHRYDLLNHLLSLGIDRRWRRKTVAALPAVPGGAYLDVATGTADVALEIARKVPEAGQIVGIDFSLPMLRRGREKVEESRRSRLVHLIDGDALRLPFGDSVFDGLTIAFGLRNLADPLQGLQEMARVLKSGGSLSILEFATPSHSWLRSLYLFYFLRLLPRVGGFISGNPQAYRYLPGSVLKFPEREALMVLLKRAGLENVAYRNLTGGIAVLYSGSKAKACPAPSLLLRPGTRFPGEDERGRRRGPL